MRIGNISYTYNEKYLNISHVIGNVGQKLSLSFNVFEKVDKVRFNFEALAKMHESEQQFSTVFKKTNYNICNFLKNPKSELLFFIFYQDITDNRRNKVPIICPVLPVSIISETEKKHFTHRFWNMFCFFFLEFVLHS